MTHWCETLHWVALKETPSSPSPASISVSPWEQPQLNHLNWWMHLKHPSHDWDASINSDGSHLRCIHQLKCFSLEMHLYQFRWMQAQGLWHHLTHPNGSCRIRMLPMWFMSRIVVSHPNESNDQNDLSEWVKWCESWLPLWAVTPDVSRGLYRWVLSEINGSW